MSRNDAALHKIARGADAGHDGEFALRHRHRLRHLEIVVRAVRALGNRQDGLEAERVELGELSGQLSAVELSAQTYAARPPHAVIVDGRHRSPTSCGRGSHFLPTTSNIGTRWLVCVHVAFSLLLNPFHISATR